MTIIGIETSHDDTSIALLEDGVILKLLTFSQIEIHAKYGGTIPEIASREHVNNIALVLNQIQQEFDLSMIDYVAYTEKPGLLGALHIGFLFASALALSLDKPLIPIDHLEGHIFSVAIEQKITYPALALIVSGGHTQLMLLKTPNDIEIIGQTQDDAVGEVYDKVARKLGLGFPGGPIIDKLANNPNNFTDLRFTIPKTENELDFSFSGIKTQVINYINNYHNNNKIAPVEQISYAFQQTVVQYLKQKITLALEKYSVKSLLLSGGVSANSQIREMFLTLHKNSLIPNLKYATDNGAMIAKAAEIKLKEKSKCKN